MPTRLQIVLNGRVPGLPKHRLSVAAFGSGLFLLLRAVRRIASDLVREAQGAAPATRGRHVRPAEEIDLDLVSIRGESPTTLTLEVVSRAASDAMPPLFDFEELTDRAAGRLLDAIERESQGHATHEAVRRFLGQLPPGLTEQRYILEPQAGARREVVVQMMDLPKLHADLPYLAEIAGNVVGVGFEPGRRHVRLKGIDGRLLVCDATPAQVEAALTLRGEDVSALVVRGAAGEADRLLYLRRLETGDPPPAIGSDQYERFIFRKWAGLLDRLAQ